MSMTKMEYLIDYYQGEMKMDNTANVTNGGCKCAGDYTKKHQIERLIRWMKREGNWDE